MKRDIRTRMNRVVHLPASDRRRRIMVEHLAHATEADRDYWLALVQETEMLRVGMQNGTELSAGAMERLLRIPEDAAQADLRRNGSAHRIPANGWRRLIESVNAIRIPWPVAASVIVVILLGGWGLYEWQDRPRQAIPLAHAPAATLEKLRTLVITAHANIMGLEIESSDPKVVQEALQAKLSEEKENLNVQLRDVQVAGFKLLGGRVLELGGKEAAYTRWRDAKGQDYSLFEFRPGDVGMPNSFLRDASTTPQGATGDKFRVMLWPAMVPAKQPAQSGGDGTQSDGTQPVVWAVVSDGNADPDPFSADVCQ